MATRTYRDLIAWQRTMELVARCDCLVRAFPRRRPSGVASQIERAVGSVAANIAEGCGRRSRADFGRHLSIANGSLLEVETHLLRAAQCGLVSPSELTHVLSLSEEVRRLLVGLERWIQRSQE